MYLYGLIGYPLSHSFSERYFAEKFANEGCADCLYRNFPISDIGELRHLTEQQPDLCGFNVTIPYKQQIIPFLDEMDSVAAETGAVNTVQVIRNENGICLKGYNTDVYGFSRSLEEWLQAYKAKPQKALVPGTGGASKAVVYALSRLDMEVHPVSRRVGEGVFKTYDQLTADDIAAHALIVNTTPLGMFPDTEQCPAIPYQYLTENHFLYDLVYNPEETLFMRRGRQMGASVHNGLQMLHLQADKAWEIWQELGIMN
jgi:shikimate dehydrogenase